MCWKSRDIPGVGLGDGMCVCVCVYDTQFSGRVHTPTAGGRPTTLARASSPWGAAWRLRAVGPTPDPPLALEKLLGPERKELLVTSCCIKRAFNPHRQSITAALKPCECGEDVTQGRRGRGGGHLLLLMSSCFDNCRTLRPQIQVNAEAYQR